MSLTTVGGLGGSGTGGGISGPIGITGTVGVTFGPIGGTVTIANPSVASATTIVGNTVFVAQGGSFVTDIGNFPAGFGVTFGPVGISGVPGVTFGVVGVTFPATPTGTTFGPVGISGVPGVTFGAIAGGVSVLNFPAVQAVTFPVNATTTVSNFPAVQSVTFPVFAGPFGITGSVGVTFGAVAGSATATVANFPAVQAVTFPVFAGPIALTGAIGITGSVGVTFGTIAGSVTSTVANFPAVQAVTFPVFAGPIGITGPISATVLNFPLGFGSTFGPVGISGVPSVTFGMVGLTGAIGITGSVNVGNFPASQGVTFPAITGSVTATIANFPAVQSVTFGVVGLTGAVGITGFVGVSFGAITGSVTSTVANFPAVQAVTFPIFAGPLSLTGAVGITGSVGVTFGSVGVTFGLVGLTGIPGVTFGTVGNTGAVGITGFVGVTFGLIGITGIPGVTFGVVGNTGAVGITGSVGVTFGTATVQGPSGTPGTPSGGILSIQGDPFGSPVAGSKIDPLNSTSTPLAAGATYTGTFVDVRGYANLTITVISSHVSATDGFMVQYSSDGVNVDDNDIYTVPANNGQQISFPLPNQFYRVLYNNSGTLQTTFRLQAKLHTSRPKPSSQRVQTPINAEQDAELVLNTPARLSLTPSGASMLAVSTTAVLAVAANTQRKGLVLTIIPGTAAPRMTFSLGTTAAFGNGINLVPGGVWQMDDYTFYTGDIYAIATAGGTLGIQQFVLP